METLDLTPLLEALLFVSDQPVTVAALVKTVDDETVTAVEVRAALDALAEAYDAENRGFHLARLGSGYQVVTRERYAPWIESFLAGRRKARLSRAALETVAVVAYKQPITRGDIERIRGVDIGAVLTTLLERNLILIKGRDPGPGRPLLYGTTQGFLDYFGLSRLTDLPRLDEIAALAKAEAPAMWGDEEIARFEKHGVDATAVPFPESAPEGEEESLEAEDGELRDEELAEFQEVVSSFSEHAIDGALAEPADATDVFATRPMLQDDEEDPETADPLDELRPTTEP
jgi:segregation and condensation protein B